MFIVVFEAPSQKLLYRFDYLGQNLQFSYQVALVLVLILTLMWRINCKCSIELRVDLLIIMPDVTVCLLA